MNAVVFAIAGLMAAMGVAALVRPAVIWAPFGVAPTTPASRSEVRAVYGGFSLAVTALLVYAVEDASAGVRAGILLALALSFFGMAAGRVVSALVEPRTLLAWPGFFLVVEIAGGSLLFLAR
ncbi:MAG: DUF4345 family protein [Aeromicrobium sp.]